jgi:hypothetical protein
MTWNYRVLSYEEDGESRYKFVEAYYNKDQEVIGYCNASLFAETPDGLQEFADRLLQATAKPILKESDLKENDHGLSDFD